MPRDNQILLNALHKLGDKGNTLVVVEHDEDTIRRADHIIDIGPSAGKRGGAWWPRARRPTSWRPPTRRRAAICCTPCATPAAAAVGHGGCRHADTGRCCAADGAPGGPAIAADAAAALQAAAGPMPAGAAGARPARCTG
jgi:hypothetical protein